MSQKIFFCIVGWFSGIFAGSIFLGVPWVSQFQFHCVGGGVQPTTFFQPAKISTLAQAGTSPPRSVAKRRPDPQATVVRRHLVTSQPQNHTLGWPELHTTPGKVCSMGGLICQGSVLELRGLCWFPVICNISNISEHFLHREPGHWIQGCAGHAPWRPRLPQLHRALRRAGAGAPVFSLPAPAPLHGHTGCGVCDAPERLMWRQRLTPPAYVCCVWNADCDRGLTLLQRRSLSSTFRFC